MSVEAPTFRRKHGSTVQESCIDHVVWSGRCASGCYVTEDGRFTTDHIPLIGWIDERVINEVGVRKSFCRAPSMKAGDKGASRRFKKEIERELRGIDIESMAVKDIIDLAVNTSKKIGKSRGRSSDSWSPAARCLEIKLSCRVRRSKHMGGTTTA